jgi:hypothetical protein
MAGLNPTNPASVFVLRMSKSAGSPSQPSLSFGPAIAGRSYTVQTRTNLLTGSWSPLAAALFPQTNSSQMTVSIQAQGFYRVQIAIP